MFKIKKIVKTEIVDQEDGLNEVDKLSNLVVGSMEGGFDGMVVADVYNQYHSFKTIFLVHYSDGTKELEKVDDESKRYYYLLQFLD